MSITRFTSWLTLASFVVVAGCTTSQPNSEQLDQLVHRTSALEQQVHDLEVSNAELQKQLDGHH
jgi:fructose-1-phosphate kinase PfkB-like protein